MEVRLAAAQTAYLVERAKSQPGDADKPHAGLALARGEWLRARDQVLPALKQYQEAQRAQPDHSAAWLGAARLLREREMWADAEKYARTGLRHRSDPSLRQELALALVGQGRLDDAEQHLEAYLRVRPLDRDTAKVLANVLVGRAYALLGQAGQRATIERLLERALAANPDEVRAHLVRGRLLKDDRRFAEALPHLERAHRALPSLDEARILWLECLSSLGYERLLQRDEDGACAAWRRCVDAAPADFGTTEIQNQLARIWQKHEAAGVAHLQAGDRAAAAASFRQCLLIQPDQHWAAWLLATALHDAPGADLAELERLCRLAIAWQEGHRLDKSAQVLLLASTLAKSGRAADGRKLAADYLRAPDNDAKPQVLAALRAFAGG